MATVSVSKTSTSVTFTVSGISVGEYIRIRFRETADTYLLYDISYRVTSVPFKKSFPSGAASGAYNVYTTNYYYQGGQVPIDLTPETDYIGEVLWKENITDASWTSFGTTTWTTDKKTEVEEWNWTISNGSATAEQTYTAYRGITEFSDAWWVGHFHYLVWNDLVNKAYEVITDRSGTWNTTYATLAETRMTASDTEITTKRWNSLWWNLAQYVSTGFSTAKVVGDKLYGEDLITIAQAVNNAIWRG